MESTKQPVWGVRSCQYYAGLHFYLGAAKQDHARRNLSFCPDELGFCCRVHYAPSFYECFARTFQDIMHLYVVTSSVVLLSITSLVLLMVGGYRKKYYPSLAIWATVALTMMLIRAIGTGTASQEIFGIFERVRNCK